MRNKITRDAILSIEKIVFVNLDENGKAISWIKAVVGGRSVGVPGVLAALKQAHEQYGKLAWSELFVDAMFFYKLFRIVFQLLHPLGQLQLFLY